MMRKISSSALCVVVWSTLLLPFRVAYAAWVVIDVDSLKTSNSSRPVFSYQKRATASQVVHNKYFIPAIASMGGVLIVVAVCFWWLGWCGNRKKMANYHAKSSYPTRRETMHVHSNVAPMTEGTKRSSQLSRKPVPSSANGSSVAGSPQAGSPTHLPPHQHVPPAPFNPATLYSNSNTNGHPVPRRDSQDRTFTSYHNGSASGGQQPAYGAFSPSATSQASGTRGFQPIPPAALAANIVTAAAGSAYAPSSRQHAPMSVQHVNTSAAAAYANTYRNIPGGTSSILQQAQRPPAQPLVDQQSAAAAAAAMRMTSFSSDTSDTQVAAEPAPGHGFMYSPHAGNTLSYASSSDPSTTSTPGVAGIGVPPIPVPAPVAQQQRPGQGQYIPQESYYTAMSVPPPNSRQQTRFSEPESADDEGMNPYDGVKRGSSRLGSSPDQGQIGSSAGGNAAPPPEYKDEKKRSESWYAQEKKKKR
ncbi:hypothetical protein CPB83DRAFT_843675 [Crepidotus variabilis]|uniref:Uncharacterized protein n=1 Tax=Crepidotus variabilis TaxID=179855 RepID=A0A9P6EUC7_9AGAR|nr:hypothetical protein CPB83DRAFT_843675 [Crepidotus variabilis]